MSAVPALGAPVARSAPIPHATIVVSQDAAEVLPATLDFGSALLGYPTPGVLTVTVGGTDPVSFGDAAVDTDRGATDENRAEDFSVGRNLCVGQTLKPGESCTVELIVTPSVPESEHAVLTLADNTTTGTSSTSLVIMGLQDGTGTYYPIQSRRLLDTRYSGSRKPLPAGGTVSVPVAGRAGLPDSGVAAAVINLTAVATTATGYLTAYPGGVARPGTSTLNFPPSWTGATMATIPVGKDGSIAVYNRAGTTHVIVDILGWYAADDGYRSATGTMGTQYEPVDRPVRIWDAVANGGRMKANQSVDLAFSFATGEDPRANERISAFALNVTAVEPTRSGYLALWDGTGDPPGTSTLNFTAGDTVPNMVLVTAAHDGSDAVGFGIANRTTGTTQVLVDLVGVYCTDEVLGQRFIPTTPVRIVDTRSGLGLSGPVKAGQTRSLTAPAGAIGEDTWVLIGTMTAIDPTRDSFLTVWDGTGTKPWVSAMNPSEGRTSAASVFIPLDPDYGYSIYNASGTLDLAIDVAGTFEQYPPSAAYSPPGGGFIQRPERSAPIHLDAPKVVTSVRG